MVKTLKQLDLSLIDDGVAHLDSLKPRPSSGWVKSLREALGMTRAQLGKRVGLSPNTINTLERSEAGGTISVGNLEKLAQGLGGRLVYAIVPPSGKTFEQLVNERAEQIARTRLARVSQTMSLEDQDVAEHHRSRQLTRIVDSLLKGSRRTLWR